MARKYVYLLAVLLCLSFGMVSKAQTKYSVSSPDERVKITVSVGSIRKAKPSRFRFNVVSDDNVLLKDKKINLTVKSDGHRAKLHKAKLTDVQHKSGTGYNSMLLFTEIGVAMEIRAYNDSICYRYAVSGYTEDYQVDNVAPIFPHDRPQAVLDTYSQDSILPWHVLDIDHDKEKTMNLPKAGNGMGSGYGGWGPQRNTSSGKLLSTRPVERNNRVLNWEDAPVTMTAGYTITDFFGKQWHSTAQQSGAMIDCTYKFLYGALSLKPCGSLTYIHYGEDYPPFEHTMGSIHSLNFGARLGGSLPIQLGYNILNITPYCAYTRMSLLQHNDRVGITKVDAQHTAIGPGIKLQIAYPEQLVFGVSYEQQFFVTDDAADSMRSWILSVGYMF